jgi:endoglucanase
LVFSLAATSAASAFCDGYCWFVGGSLSGTVATPLPVPTPTPTPTPTNPTPSSYPKLVGTNMGGGDMDWQSLPPVSGTNYLFPDTQDIAYALSLPGLNFIRLIFCWEALQPTLNGAFNTTYFNQMNALVSQITAAKCYVMLDPHPDDQNNGVYAGYMGNLIGSSQVPDSAFANLWSQLATTYKNNPYVIFGSVNEPNNQSTMQYFTAAQSQITAIRATGATNLIMIGGNDYQCAATYSNANWYDTASPQVSNATGFLTLKDPLNNTVISVHSYVDSDLSGTTTDITSAQAFVNNLTPLVSWARTNKLMIHISEFACSATNSLASSACANMLTYMKQNEDVILGCAWWCSGSSWFNSYMFTLNPSNNYTTPSPQLALFQPFLAY